MRRADNWQNNGFVGDVNSQQIRCFQSGLAGSKTYTVAAGSSITYNVAPNAYHPGPMSFYLAKAPNGTDISTWPGTGPVFFKIQHEQPNFGQQLTWPSNG